MTLRTKNVRSESGEVISDSAVHTTDVRTATDVVFYMLGKKFVEDKGDIPEDAKDVIYYTLAMGHNTGVVDCFEPKLALSRANFDNFLNALPEGDGKTKLKGIEKFGEIQISKEEVREVRDSVSALCVSNVEFETPRVADNDRYADIRAVEPYEFKAALLEVLKKIEATPQVYCLARRVTQ